MEISFIDLNLTNVVFLFFVGLIGGLVSGFIGSGGAFVLTPAMMNMGVPAIMAVASNMCHKFPKALVGAMKRHKYGQVDVKLGLIMGLSAEAGVLYGAHVQEKIVEAFGKAGSNLYVSIVFVVVLAIVGSYVLRDAWNMYHAKNQDEEKVGKIALWVRSIKIPGTMVYFKSIDAEVSFLFTLPLGFATGMLAATIAVGGFIGVPAMMYILGVPGITASATELVIAFVMGTGGTIKFAWAGFVDIRLAMIILAGSLFGIQLGAIGTTYVKAYMVKVVMGVIMVLVLFSRGVVVPVYLSDLDLISKIEPATAVLMKNASLGLLIFALVTGATIVLSALISGMRQHRSESTKTADSPSATQAPSVAQMQTISERWPQRILLVADTSEFSEYAINEGINLAKRCQSELHAMSVLPPSIAGHESLAHPVLHEEKNAALSHLKTIHARAEEKAVPCQILLGHGETFSEIVEEATYSNMELIVMGRRNKSDFVRTMLGSTTAKVIERTPCHVLVIPRETKFEGKGILLIIDSAHTHHAATSAVLNLAKRYSASVIIFSVAAHEQHRETAQSVMEQTQALFLQAGIDVTAKVYIGKIDKSMVSVARNYHEMDLIAIDSHRTDGLKRLLGSNVSEEIIGSADYPVLVAAS